MVWGNMSQCDRMLKRFAEKSRNSSNTSGRKAYGDQCQDILLSTTIPSRRPWFPLPATLFPAEFDPIAVSIRLSIKYTLPLGETLIAPVDSTPPPLRLETAI